MGGGQGWRTETLQITARNVRDIQKKRCRSLTILSGENYHTKLIDMVFQLRVVYGCVMDDVEEVGVLLHR
jgi:hypothetical protein